LLFIIAGHNIRITRLLNAISQQLTSASYENSPWPEIKIYQDKTNNILNYMTEPFENRSAAEKISLPVNEEDLHKLNLSPKTISLSAEDYSKELINDLLSKITKETIGLYYSIKQL
jgi:hypothetical protein